MKRYIIFVETCDILPHSVSYTCDENTLETTLRVARETKDVVRVEVKEIKDEVIKEEKSNEPVKNVYVEVDNDFDPDYYKESSNIYIEYEDTVSRVDDDYVGVTNDIYLVSGYESEVDNFLKEADKHILAVEKKILKQDGTLTIERKEK